MTLADGLQIKQLSSVSEARTKGKQLYFTLLLFPILPFQPLFLRSFSPPLLKR